MKLSVNSYVFLIILIVLGFSIYSNVFYGDFCFDDIPFIVDNPAVRDVLDFTAIYNSFHMRFLTGWSFALNYWMSGYDVLPFHLTNIFLHILVAWLVYVFVALCLQTPSFKSQTPVSTAKRTAFIAALIFLCHPLQTQAVAFINQRATLLAAFFYLSTIVSFLKYKQSQKFYYVVVSFFSMTLGLFCKQVTVTLPFALMLIHWLFLEEDSKKEKSTFNFTAFYFLPLIVFAVFASLESKQSVYQYHSLVAVERFDYKYILTEINVLRTYLRLLILPINQTLDYDYAISRSVFEPGLLWSLVLLLTLFIAGIRFRRKYKIFSFFVFWFFLTTSVETMAVIFGNRGVIYEHWLYVPMVGFSFLVAHCLLAINYRPERQVGQKLAVGLIVMLSFLSFQRNFVWQDEETLWRDVIIKSPSKGGGYLALGSVYYKKGQLGIARQYYLKAQKLYEQRQAFNVENRIHLSRVYNNLGIINADLSDKKQARFMFQQAVSVNSNNTEALNNLGISCFLDQDYQKAIDYISRGLPKTKDPSYANYYLGRSYLGNGEADKAKSHLSLALKLFLAAGDKEKVQEIEAILLTLEH